MLQFLILMGLALVGQLVFGAPEGDFSMAVAPFVAPLIGAGIGALGSIFGGGPKDPLRPESREFFEENIRGYGGAGQQAITGYDPRTGQFGDPTGPFAGPLAEGFDPSSISRFADPNIAAFEEMLGQKHQLGLEQARFDASQAAARTGSGRGSRAGVALGERQAGADRAYFDALLQGRLGFQEQASRTALAAQPYRNQALDANQALRRFGMGMEAANFGFGSDPSQYLTAEAYTGEKKPNILSGAISGAITGAGFGGGGGGGSPLSAGQIQSISPNVVPSDFQIPGNFGLPTSVNQPWQNPGFMPRNPMFGG